MKDCCRPDAAGGRAWGASPGRPPGAVARLRGSVFLAAALALLRFALPAGAGSHASAVAVETLYFVPVLLAARTGLSAAVAVLSLLSLAIAAQATWDPTLHRGLLADQAGLAASLWLVGLMSLDRTRRPGSGPEAPPGG